MKNKILLSIISLFVGSIVFGGAVAWALPGTFIQGGNSFAELATLGTNDNFSLAIETNNTERARFDTSGNFGIGTTTPGSKLDVSGTANISGNTTIGGTLGVTGATTLSGGLTINLGSDATGDMYYRNSLGTLAKISAGAENTVLTMGNSNIPEWEASGSVVGGYVLPISSDAGGADLADSTTYYIGSTDWGGPLINSTTSGLHRIYIPKTGTIKTIYLYVRTNDATASNENVEFYIRLNNSSDTTITTTRTFSAVSQLVSNSNLNLVVNAGDYLEVKMVTPTWATNPTGVRIAGSVYIE